METSTFEAVLRLRKQLEQMRKQYDFILRDWLVCDFSNVWEIEELKQRTRKLLNDPIE